MAVLTEHRLLVGDRAVTLLEGGAGWGECSLLDDYPCDPAMARQAAEEAASVGWPAALRDTVAVNALVTDASFDAADLDGFDTVKVKLRALADVDLVARVRDTVGPKVSLRVDANGAWDLETASAVIARLAALDVDLVEQPVASLDDLARLRRDVSVPLAADECVRTIADAQRLRSLDAADAVVLKVQPLGGVRAALAVADAAGVPAIPTSMMETSVGIAAGLALAAALPELPYACGLGTAALLTHDVTREPLIPERGVLRVRAVVPDRGFLERYSLSSQEVTT
ncbi:MAG: O-succinylbenzoate synthase [Actinobacteria bacterium]|nr:O-succinylbenzoate synthase [Actinomycetota bacterium]